MIDVKKIRIDRIDSKNAILFVKKNHYSGSVASNSQLHFGAFYENKLHGVMSFGPSLDKSKLIQLVEGTKWNEFIELNRMVFDEFLPKNSESRSLAIALKLIKKNCPHIKWIISFADACQCGSGTIYQASGFYLTGFSQGSMWILPENLAKIHGKAVTHEISIKSKSTHLAKHLLPLIKGKSLGVKKLVEQFGGEQMKGYMFRYIYFLHKNLKENLTVPILPFSKIKELNGYMYKGEGACVV